MLRPGKAAGSCPVASPATKMATMRKTLALIPTLMPAMRPSEMDARTASPPPKRVVLDSQCRSDANRRQHCEGGSRGNVRSYQTYVRRADARRNVVGCDASRVGALHRTQLVLGDSLPVHP